MHEVPEGQELDPASLPSSLPGYLIKLKAELKIDGEIVQSGGYFSLGQELSSASAITMQAKQQAWLDAIPNIAENQDWITGIDEQQIETLFDEYDAQLQAYVDQNQPDIAFSDCMKYKGESITD